MKEDGCQGVEKARGGSKWKVVGNTGHAERRRGRVYGSRVSDRKQGGSKKQVKRQRKEKR